MSSAAGHSSDSARQESPKSTVDFFWSAGSGDAALDPMVRLALDEMAAAWHAGRPTPAEHWLDRHSHLAASPPLAVRVIFEEVCLREEQGQRVESAEIFARFPQFKQALEVVLDCHALIQSEPRKATFPEVGSQLGELQLLAELGRGGQGRVFLATQPSLSDRPLVVKITPRTGDEHLSLARLQHTHIAPLYLVQEFPEENLRALCMPFLGGASWSQLLQVLRSQPLSERQGRHIIVALESEHHETHAPRSEEPDRKSVM